MSRAIFEDRAISRYDEIFQEILNLALNRFRWENLPNGLTSEQLELLLISKGQLMFFEDENLGFLILPAYKSNDINIYGLSNSYNIYAENGKYNKTIELETYEENEKIINGVLIKNNHIASPQINNLQIFAKRIDDIEMTQDVNLFQQCIPKLILADEDTKLTAKSIIEKITKFKFVIFGKKSLMNNIGSDVLDTSAPYVLDKLQEYKTEVKNELLTLLGINNNNNIKKERMITDEVNANNDYINTNIDLMFEMREKACKLINENFPIYKKLYGEIKVRKKEVEKNGYAHDDFGRNGRE